MRTGTASTRYGVILTALGLLVTGGCGEESGAPPASIPSSSESAGTGRPGSSPGQKSDEPVTLVATDGTFRSPAPSDAELHPEVSIQTNVGTIQVRLNWEKAPRTVSNFLYNYVETGFYDQTVVHYVESSYLIAGGGYTAALEEKETQPPIPCEADNGLSNERGTIAMARLPDFANSATSQFFINLVDNPDLDYRADETNSMNGYCVFGEVISGMDVVDKIAQMPVHEKNGLMNTPVEPVIIESVTRTK
ncbi:MAG: peptidylprolyl isomerase [Planctomycetota bacterium]